MEWLCLTNLNFGELVQILSLNMIHFCCYKTENSWCSKVYYINANFYAKFDNYISNTYILIYTLYTDTHKQIISQTVKTLMKYHITLDISIVSTMCVATKQFTEEYNIIGKYITYDP